MSENVRQLISYIAPAAPATRRYAEGDEPFLRPEVGFTPNWYRQHASIDFGERWHVDPEYRRQTITITREELNRRFPGTRIGGIDRPDKPLDLLTGVFGGSFIAAIYGVPIIYAQDNWPNCAHQYLSDDEMASLAPPDLDTNEFFQRFMEQLDWIEQGEGQILGFINPQGILNNAQRLRGETIFQDMMESPELCTHLFDCIYQTMTDAVDRIHERQAKSGVDITFFTVSNCLVNMVSAKHYAELLLPWDQKIGERYGCIGIHNCAWTADPYVESYATVENLAYIDMGFESNLPQAKIAFPDARRSIMYTPMDVANKSFVEISDDFERIADLYGPCDIVLADIEAGTPDQKVRAVVNLCEEISRYHQQ